MENEKMAYREKFPVGSNVRIQAAQQLEEFRRMWRYHHPISVEQIAYGGQQDCVAGVSFYHGGDVLYNLEKAPGIWHEQLLEHAVIRIYVNLLNEGTPCSRPTGALALGDGLFKLLPTEDYDPDDEEWEFLPGTIVRGVEAHRDGEVYLLACHLGLTPE